jgi:hypothetical protein
MSMQLRAVIPILSLLLIAGCGGGSGPAAPSTVTIGGTVTGLVGKLVLQNNAGDNLSVMANGAFTFATPLNKGVTYAVTILTQPPGPSCVVSSGSGAAMVNVTSVSVACTTDPATVFLPISASAVSDSTVSGATGLFVISSKSPGDPPIQITTEGIDFLALQAQYTLGAQGRASTGNPYALLYTTLNSPSGDHVWSLNLSGTSTLVPTQLSNLTIPYRPGGTAGPARYCRRLVVPKNLADPSSALLILGLPTDAGSLCGGSAAAIKWWLIHSSDGPTTDPVSLPALLGRTILPLYRPDGALAGFVAIDASNNLNFYPDETFTHPQLLLSNAAYFRFQQEIQSGPISTISADPTYSFLLVAPSLGASSTAVHRVDYSGSISADLYDLGGGNGSPLVDSGNLYFTELSGNLESVGRIPGDGGPMQILGSTSAQQSSWLPVLAGVSGSNLVFWGSTAQQQWHVQTLPAGTPGTFTTIASSNGVPVVSFASGDIFVTWANSLSSADSTQILDSTGNVLQASMPSSYFASLGAPAIQVRNVTDSGGGGVYVLDLSQPSSPTPVALKTVTGTAFNLPSGSEVVSFRQVTPTIGVAEGRTGGGLVYDLAKGVVVPVSIPNSNFWFLTDAATLDN